MIRTILVVPSPRFHLSKTGVSPEILRAHLRILEALLNLDTFMRLHHGPQDSNFLEGRDEGLMTAAFLVVDVFADDAPVGDVEDLLAVDVVGIGKAVEDEPKHCECETHALTKRVVMAKSSYSCVTPLLSGHR